MTKQRPRHPVPELEDILTRLEEAQWLVTKRPRGYFKAYCPCGEHLKTVHLTPRRDYRRHLVNYLERETCWKG